MGIEIEMTGSGELGPIAPGWSVQEYATPIVPGESAGGTGGVTFSAAAKDTSLFVSNNSITTTVDNLGDISGVVKSVSQTGLNVSINHNTELALFDANFKIPALGAGGVYPAVDLASQLIKRDILLTAGTGRLYCLCGHSAGFDNQGNLAESVIRYGSYEANDPSYGLYNVDYAEQTGKIWATNFAVVNNEILATSVMGDSFPVDITRPSSRIAFKTLMQGSNVLFNFEAKPITYSAGYGQSVGFVINPVAKTVSIGATYGSGGSSASVSDVKSIASLNMATEIVAFFEYVRPTSTVGTFTAKVTICNSSNYAAAITATVSFSALQSPYNAPWTVTGNVYDIWRADDTGIPAAEFVREYVAPYTFHVGHTVELHPPVPAVEMNLWEYLQMACSAYGHEIAVIDNIIHIRDIDQTVVDVTNIVGSPTVSPATILSGKNVDIVYSNASSVVNVELYNARNDNNRVISVNTDEVVTTTVEIKGTPTVINLPYRDNSAPNDVGSYCITHSTGNQIPQSLFEKYGGRLRVAISTTASNAIDITFTGPNSGLASAGYVGPYKLAFNDGSNDYAALSITGSGILTDVKTLHLQTAADPTKVTQETASTVTNQFICTLEQAYDRGLLTAIHASGPKVTLSGTIPVTAISSFGLVAGSRIWYRDSIYRVTDANIGNLGVSFNAVRHVTVNDFDTLWAGKTVGRHDRVWDKLETQDQIIAPMLFEIASNIVTLLDIDGVPYYATDGTSTISIFTDTDGVAYYLDGHNLPGYEPIYLDDDGNPYFEGV